VKLDAENIIQTALGVILGISVVGVVALIAHRFLGVFSYPGIGAEGVNKVAEEYDKRFKIVTRAHDGNATRGVYDMGGSLYYYKYIPDVSYEIYPLIIENYSAGPALMNNTRLALP
jgi:hypothetical protein